MHSQSEYIITKKEVHGYANLWLEAALKLEYEGYKCNGGMVLQILLIAASRVVSIFAACRDLADAPSDDTIRNALFATLPDIAELEKRLNRSLCTELPKALTRKSRKIAIDLTLIPYHGQPAFDKKEIYRSKPKSGTSHFHAYATAIVVHKGYRFTLALTYVQRGEALKDVVKRLIRLVRRQGVKIKYTLLDKEFCSVEVMQYLKRAKYGFIIAAPVRGRKKKKKNAPLTGLRALRKKKNGYYSHTFTRQEKSKTKQVKVTICVSGKSYLHKKTGKKKYKKLLYAIWKVRLTPREIREEYRKRFGVETSYRQMNEARIKTCTRDPRLRLLFIGVALVLRNVWVWLHFRLAKAKYSEEPIMLFELMRFKEMLLWITQIVQLALGADKTGGIKVADYKRLVARYLCP
jgi:putative transposase